MFSMFFWLDFLDCIFSLLIRSPKVVGLCVLHHLEDDKKVIITSIGLRWLIYISHIWVNHRFLTALAEQWHSKNNTFCWPTGEAIITLEDVYSILRVPCHGDPMSMVIMFWYLFVLSFSYPYEVCWYEILHITSLLWLDPNWGEVDIIIDVLGCDHPRLRPHLGEVNRWV